MRVTMFQNVDVEAEVDVSIDDVLAEFSRRFEEAEQSGECPHRSVYLPLIDLATRLMARVPPKAITACQDSQRAEVVTRLQAEIERWSTIVDSSGSM